MQLGSGVQCLHSPSFREPTGLVFLGKRRGEVEVMEELEMIGKRRESGGDGLLDSVYLW